jgi:hypothetical protein
MVKKINALKARQSLGQLVEEVYYKGDQFIYRAGWKAEGRGSPDLATRRPI